MMCDTSTPSLPLAPKPSADTGIVLSLPSSAGDAGILPDGNHIDIFTLTPVAALKLLCSTVETLVHITGDVPPTPPVSHPTTPNLRVIQAEKEQNARRSIDNSNGRVRTPQPTEGPRDVDVVPEKAKTPIGSPEAGLAESLQIVGSNMEPPHVQHGAITRKFYSKKPPQISLEEYLLRLHQYCPMSTAVYLATSFYIHRLAIIEKIISVTARNVHRLLLAGLRVAMKALEDLSYPHRRFAKVGGVSETELGRLEVSFCFVTNFELKVDEEMLLKHATTVRNATNLYKLPKGFAPKIPPLKDKIKTSVTQNIPVRTIGSEAPAAV